MVNPTNTAPLTHSWDSFQLTLPSATLWLGTSSYFSLEPREREGSTATKHTHTHTHTLREREEETKHNGWWRMGAWISWVSHTQVYNHKLTNIYTYLHIYTLSHTHTHTLESSYNMPRCCGLMNKSMCSFTALKQWEYPETPSPWMTPAPFQCFSPRPRSMISIACLIRHGLSD